MTQISTAKNIDELIAFARKTTDYIPVENLVDNGRYKILGENTFIGVWQATENRFLVSRFEMERHFYVGFERHWDEVNELGIRGTAKPIELIKLSDIHVLYTRTLVRDVMAGNVYNLRFLDYLNELEARNPISKYVNTVNYRSFGYYQYIQNTKLLRNGIIKKGDFVELSLESFLTGRSNMVAFDHVSRFVNCRHHAFLWLHGYTGVGKTHLMKGALRQYIHSLPNAKACYLHAEIFFREFRELQKTGDTNKIALLFADLDILAMDGLQFLQDKESAFKLLLSICNTLVARNKKIIFDSELHPSNYPCIIDFGGEKLIQQFEFSEIQEPDIELKRKVITEQLRQFDHQFKLDNDVVESIIVSSTNIRELKGVVSKLNAEWNMERNSE